MKTIEFVFLYEGLAIDCVLDYQPAERQTFDHPAVHEEVTLCTAVINGSDISGLLSKEARNEIEAKALIALNNYRRGRW